MTLNCCVFNRHFCFFVLVFSRLLIFVSTPQMSAVKFHVLVPFFTSEWLHLRGKCLRCHPRGVCSAFTQMRMEALLHIFQNLNSRQVKKMSTSLQPHNISHFWLPTFVVMLPPTGDKVQLSCLVLISACYVSSPMSLSCIGHGL